MSKNILIYKIRKGLEVNLIPFLYNSISCYYNNLWFDNVDIIKIVEYKNIRIIKK
jgi:hypothetical protein